MARTGGKTKSIDTTFEIVDHLAHADAANDLEKSDFSTFAVLADYDTVSVKISEITDASDEGLPYEDTTPTSGGSWTHSAANASSGAPTSPT